MYRYTVVYYLIKAGSYTTRDRMQRPHRRKLKVSHQWGAAFTLTPRTLLFVVF